MRTNYAVGDRCRVEGAEGTVTEVLTDRRAYRVKLDDGRAVCTDERNLRAAGPSHKMVEGPRRGRKLTED